MTNNRIHFFLLINKKLLLLFLFTAIFFAYGYSQQTRAEIQKQQRELQQELNDLNASLSDVRQNKKTSLRELSLLQQKMDARRELIGSINNQLSDLDETITKYNKQIDSCKRQLDTLKTKYAQSIVNAYKNRNSYNYISFLFSSTSFNDAYRRIAYLKSYRKFRESQVSNILTAQTTLRQNITRLENTKQEKNNALALQGNQLQSLQTDKVQQDSTLNSLKGQEGDLTNEIAANAAKQKKVQALLRTVIRREIEEAEAKERARLAAQRRAQQERDRIAEQQKALADKQQDLAINNVKPTTQKSNVVRPSTDIAATKPTRKPTDKSPVTKITPTDNSNAVTKTRPTQTQQQSQTTTTPPATTPDNNATKVATNNNPPQSSALQTQRENRSYNVLESSDESLTQSLDFEKNRGHLPWPVSGGFISQSYGIQTIPGTSLKQENDGVEISSNGGSGAVKAVASGTVSVVSDDDGVTIIIRHGKYFTTYSNLSSANVNRGDNVNAGTVIGQMSSDGNTKSMFFRVDDSKGNPMNPMNWIGGH